MKKISFTCNLFLICITNSSSSTIIHTWSIKNIQLLRTSSEVKTIEFLCATRKPKLPFIGYLNQSVVLVLVADLSSGKKFKFKVVCQNIRELCMVTQCVKLVSMSIFSEVLSIMISPTDWLKLISINWAVCKLNKSNQTEELSIVQLYMVIKW